MEREEEGEGGRVEEEGRRRRREEEGEGGGRGRREREEGEGGGRGRKGDILKESGYGALSLVPPALSPHECGCWFDDPPTTSARLLIVL